MKAKVKLNSIWKGRVTFSGNDPKTGTEVNSVSLQIDEDEADELEVGKEYEITISEVSDSEGSGKKGSGVKTMTGVTAAKPEDTKK